MIKFLNIVYHSLGIVIILITGRIVSNISLLFSKKMKYFKIKKLFFTLKLMIEKEKICIFTDFKS
jgi:hypothetical protein